MDWLGTILASAGTALIVGIIGYWFYVRRTIVDLKNAYESRFNEKRWEAYTKFAFTIPKLIETLGEKTASSEEKARRLKIHLSELAEFSSSLWLVASDDVVQAYLAWQAVKSYSDAYFLRLGEIAIAMRKDLGYTSTQVSSAELVLLPLQAAGDLKAIAGAAKQDEGSKGSPAPG